MRGRYKQRASRHVSYSLGRVIVNQIITDLFCYNFFLSYPIELLTEMNMDDLVFFSFYF